ncbi:MAG: DNA primase [Bacillota bacterium]|nr:DNA primase [Bacillota bacterium]
MANLIPQEIIEEILQQSNIVDVVGEYVSLRKRGRNFFGLCPFHNEDTPSFSVNEDKQIYKCFGCGQGGNVIGFLQEIEHIPFADAVRRLADRQGIKIPEKNLSPEEQRRMQERQSLLAMHQLAANFYREQLSQSRQAQAYLKKRAISPEVAARFGLGAAPEEDWQALHNVLNAAGYSQQLQLLSGLVSRSAKNGRFYDKFHGRLIFPIRDARGAVIAFGGRAINEEQPKYLNSQTSPIYNKSQHLYGLDLAGESIRSRGQVVIMEGYMDVLSAHQHGVSNAVASLGTAFTGEQARLLYRYAPEQPAQLQVVLAFDGDAAGTRAALASLERLSSFEFTQPRVLLLPEQQDPDDFLRRQGLEGWEALLEKNSYPTLDYLLLKAMERQDSSTAAGKGAIVAELLPAMRRCSNATELESFILQLSRSLHVPESAIRADLSRSGRSSQPAAPARPSRRSSPCPPDRPCRIANRQLLIFSLSDKNIFENALSELGENFPSNNEEAQLIDFICDLGPEYDFDPRTLFNHLNAEKEGLRQFLLKLLETDCPTEDRERLAGDYICSIQRHAKKERLLQLQKQIAEADQSKEDTLALMKEKYELTRELKGL